MNRAVFLDRDNTIIATDRDRDVAGPAELVLTKGAATAIASLRGLGFKIIVVTNQAAVARGVMGEADVEAVHQRINELVQQTSGSRIDRFYYCPYHPEGTVEKYAREHPWRKPQPGMISQAAGDFQIDLRQSWTIGDSLRDVAAGAAAGTRTILLEPDAEPVPLSGRATPAYGTVSFSPEDLPEPLVRQDDGEIEPPPKGPDYVARNLTEAARIIAQARRKEPDTPPRPPAPAAAEAPPGPDKSDVAVSPPEGPQPQLEPAVIAGNVPSIRPVRPADRRPVAPLGPGIAGSPEPSPPTGDVDRQEQEQAAADRDGERPRADTRDGGDAASRLPRIETPVVVHAAGGAEDAPSQPDGPIPHPAEPTAPTAPTTQPGMGHGSGPAEEASPSPRAGNIAADVPAVDDERGGEGEREAPSTTATAAGEPDRATGPESDDTIQSTPPRTIPAERTLREILQELRNQRVDQDEFTHTHMMAIILQLFAALCLLGALMFGQGGEDGAFMRWLGVGLLVQLAVIATLLFNRR